MRPDVGEMVALYIESKETDTHLKRYTEISSENEARQAYTTL